MTAIKNFEGFKKSLLTATKGTMEETFDSSVLFSGCEYHSYRVYVDAIHYYNMFVIHNFATNTYDVALETTCCGTSTMSRKIKTQKSLIESVVAWISCNYLNTKKIDSDSEEYTDMCEETSTATEETGEALKDTMEVNQELNVRFGKETNETFEKKQNKYPHLTSAFWRFPTMSEMYNDTCFCCPADRQENRCGGKAWCNKTWDRYNAIINPEWHHVNLETLHNIDFDMLDEKRKVYLSFYKKWQEARKNLRKCSCGNSYERCWHVFRKTLTIALDKKKITKALVEYFDRQISMVNVECGVWPSAVEVATGQKESRKFKRQTLRY